MSKPGRKYPPEVTRQKMIDWCNKAERCQWDIRNKLMEWQIPSTERETLISELISTGFVNEQRYASAFAHDKHMLHQWGARKISMQLKAKGISDRNIKDAVSALDKEETFETVQKLIQKKLPQCKGLQAYQKRMKLTRFLLSKGYDMEIISKALQIYIDGDSEF